MNSSQRNYDMLTFRTDKGFYDSMSDNKPDSDGKNQTKMEKMKKMMRILIVMMNQVVMEKIRRRWKR